MSDVRTEKGTSASPSKATEACTERAGCNGVDEILVQKALDFAREEHEKIMAAVRAGPLPAAVSNVLPASTPLAAIAQLTPAHIVGNMAIFHRIYVGSIQFDITEKDLEILFGQFGPVRSVALMQDPVNKRHRGYGFIEFETPEAASLAQQQMDGADLGGRSIRVGRPNNFPTDLPPGVPRPCARRIYVANVHELIQEAELRTVFEAFGKITHCHLIPDPVTRNHKGYGYVEYEQATASIAAIGALNNFELAKRQLKVGKTVVGGPIPEGMESLKQSPSVPTITTVPMTSSPPSIVTNSSIATSSSGSGSGSGLGSHPSTASPSLAAAARARVPSAVLRAVQQINETLAQQPSVMLLRNMEEYHNLSHPEAIAELQADVTEECSKFGEVKQVKIHLDPVTRTVSVFVQFVSAASLPEAIRVMHRRWFAGHQIEAISYDEARFLAGDLSG